MKKIIVLVLSMIAMSFAGTTYKNIKQLHCTFNTVQSGYWNYPESKWLYETKETYLVLDIVNPYSKNPLIVGNNGNSKLEILGTFSQHSHGSKIDKVPYQLVQWVERVGSKYLDDIRRANIIVWEPKLKHIRYIKTYDDMNFTYIGTCSELK